MTLKTVYKTNILLLKIKTILCFQGPQEAKLGTKVDVVFTFKNPLLEELSNCFLTVEGTRLRRPVTFTIPLVYKAQLMKYKYIDLRLRRFTNMNWNVYQNLVWNILQDQHILICRTFCNDNRTLWPFFGRFLFRCGSGLFYRSVYKQVQEGLVKLMGF